jgi:hypothetical protein
MPGYEDELRHLDEMLSCFAARPGMAERRRKLRRDPKSFSEVFAELNAVDWILGSGYEIRLPPIGPDIRVELMEGELPIEVTTPRRLVWKDDVADRLWILAELEGVSFTVESESEPNPGDVSPDQATTLFLDAAKELVRVISEHPKVKSPSKTLDEIDCVISINRHDPRRIVFRTSIAASRRYGAYWYAKEAARQKAGQFVPGIPNALLVSLDQMAEQDQLGFDVSLTLEPSDIPIHWEEVPPEVHFLLMCRSRRSHSDPIVGRWIKNPNSPYENPQGSIELLQALFPGGSTSQLVQLPPLELDENWFTFD